MKGTFLIIFEDGTVRKADYLSNDDFASFDDTITIVINLNSNEPMYYDDGWHLIESIQKKQKNRLFNEINLTKENKK